MRHLRGNGESRVPQRQELQRSYVRASANPTGSYGARTALRRCPHWRTGTRPLDSSSINQPLSLAIVSQQPNVSAAAGAPRSQTENPRIRIAHHSLYYIEPLLLWAKEKCSFYHLPQRKLLFLKKSYYGPYNVHKLLFYLISKTTQVVYSSQSRWGKWDSEVLNNLSEIKHFWFCQFFSCHSRVQFPCDRGLWKVNSLLQW